MRSLRQSVRIFLHGVAAVRVVINFKELTEY